MKSRTLVLVAVFCTFVCIEGLPVQLQGILDEVRYVVGEGGNMIDILTDVVESNFIDRNEVGYAANLGRIKRSEDFSDVTHKTKRSAERGVHEIFEKMKVVFNALKDTGKLAGKMKNIYTTIENSGITEEVGKLIKQLLEEFQNSKALAEVGELIELVIEKFGDKDTSLLIKGIFKTLQDSEITSKLGELIQASTKLFEKSDISKALGEMVKKMKEEIEDSEIGSKAKNLFEDVKQLYDESGTLPKMADLILTLKNGSWGDAQAKMKDLFEKIHESDLTPQLMSLAADVMDLIPGMEFPAKMLRAANMLNSVPLFG